MYNGQMAKKEPTVDVAVFAADRWNKQVGAATAHYIKSFSKAWPNSSIVACGANLYGHWDEWKVHEDLGRVPLCEACKARVHA